jgi:hypothetical protein
MNVQTKKQSNQWMHIYSPNKPKRFTQTLSAYEKADGIFFLGQKKSADGRIYATRDHNNKCTAKQKNCTGPAI